MVHVMGDDGFLIEDMREGAGGRTGGTYGHLGEVAAKDARDIVGGVVFGLPIEGFSVLWSGVNGEGGGGGATHAGGCLEGGLEVTHAFGGAIYTKGAFDLGSWGA